MSSPNLVASLLLLRKRITRPRLLILPARSSIAFHDLHNIESDATAYQRKAYSISASILTFMPLGNGWLPDWA